MSNARFSILQARAVKDKRISDSQFRTLAALGMYANEDGWCFPSLTTLGKDLSKSKQAVGRDTIALRKLGYLEVTARFDEKTGARRSSLYRLKFDLPPRQPDVDTPSTPEIDTPSTDSVDTPSTPDVDVNDPINDPLNDPEEAAGRNPLFDIYESKIGSITSKIADDIEAAEKKYGFAWIVDVILLSHGIAKHWNYCAAILERWKREGREEKQPTKNGKKQKAADREDRNAYITGEYAEYINR